MTCTTCSQDRAIIIEHTLRIGRRFVAWRECVRCYLEAERA